VLKIGLPAGLTFFHGLAKHDFVLVVRHSVFLFSTTATLISEIRSRLLNVMAGSSLTKVAAEGGWIFFL